MPIIDMPLEELEKYRGESPCPDDIDAFWDKAISDMKSINPKTEIIPADFKCSFADSFDMFFYGIGGAKIHAKYLKPKKQKNKAPALCKFHGYRLSSGDWTELAMYAAEGFHIASLDCRGQAGQSQDIGAVNGNTVEGHIIRGVEDGPDHLLYRSIFLDCAQLASILIETEEIDEKRVGCFGASQGGALTLACASLEPRISMVASIYPFLCDYKRVWEMDLGLKAYQEIREWFKKIDPLHERENEFFHTLSYIDIQNLVRRMKSKVLMITGLMDEVCPPSTQFAAFNKIPSEKKMIVYPDYGHEALPFVMDKIFEYFQKL